MIASDTEVRRFDLKLIKIIKTHNKRATEITRIITKFGAILLEIQK